MKRTVNEKRRKTLSLSLREGQNKMKKFFCLKRDKNTQTTLQSPFIQPFFVNPYSSFITSTSALYAKLMKTAVKRLSLYTVNLNHFNV